MHVRDEGNGEFKLRGQVSGRKVLTSSKKGNVALSLLFSYKI